MNALVIFDSTYGNTRRVAEAIAAELGGTAAPVAEAGAHDPAGADVLVVGSPINGWMPTEKIRGFLDGLAPGSLRGVRAAAFDTRVKLFIHGDARKKIAAALARAGATPLLPPAAFYVRGAEGPLLDGELDRARAWAREIRERLFRGQTTK